MNSTNGAMGGVQLLFTVLFQFGWLHLIGVLASGERLRTKYDGGQDLAGVTMIAQFAPVALAAVFVPIGIVELAFSQAMPSLVVTTLAWGSLAIGPLMLLALLLNKPALKDGGGNAA